MTVHKSAVFSKALSFQYQEDFLLPTEFTNYLHLPYQYHLGLLLVFLMESNHIPGEGNGTPLQYSCLANPMDRGAWWAAVHGINHTLVISLSELQFLILKTSTKSSTLQTCYKD